MVQTKEEWSSGTYRVVEVMGLHGNAHDIRPQKPHTMILISLAVCCTSELVSRSPRTLQGVVESFKGCRAVAQVP
jgi:hypothetical protein